ncbi:MAG: hypothetical protein DRO36_00395 [Candidatus Hecatellales archaeon]|nr:MAG: hypothetical protein DRO36_00395 [Candidatus Hecatellales archaeon]
MKDKDGWLSASLTLTLASAILWFIEKFFVKIFTSDFEVMVLYFPTILSILIYVFLVKKEGRFKVKEKPA